MLEGRRGDLISPMTSRSAPWATPSQHADQLMWGRDHALDGATVR